MDVERAAAENGSADHRALAREAARASIVLLKNDAGVLPLAKATRSIAVIGVDAEEARLGGYSGPGNQKVSILDGLRRAAANASAIRYAPGPGRIVRDLDVVPAAQLSSESGGRTVQGLTGEYFDNPRLEGAPRLTRTDTRMDFRWTLNSPGRGIPFDWYSVRWTGTIVAPASGVTKIGVEGNDGYRLFLDDRLVIDDWQKRSFGTRTADVALRAGVAPRDSSRVLRSDRQRPREADLGCRRRGRCRRDDRGCGEPRPRLRRRRHRRRRRGRGVSRPRPARPPGEAGSADRSRRRDRQAHGRRPHRRQRDHDAVARSRRRGDRRVVSGRGGRRGRRGRAVRRRESGGPVAGHVSGRRRPAAALLQPQADRPRRRLRRSHGTAALSVRLRPELHDVRLRGPRDRSGGDRRGRHGDGAIHGDELGQTRGRRGRAAVRARPAGVSRAARHGAEEIPPRAPRAGRARRDRVSVGP